MWGKAPRLSRKPSRCASLGRGRRGSGSRPIIVRLALNGRCVGLWPPPLSSLCRHRLLQALPQPQDLLHSLRYTRRSSLHLLVASGCTWWLLLFGTVSRVPYLGHIVGFHRLSNRRNCFQIIEIFAIKSIVFYGKIARVVQWVADMTHRGV